MLVIYVRLHICMLLKKKTGSTGNQQQTDCLDETADRRKCFYLMTSARAVVV